MTTIRLDKEELDEVLFSATQDVMEQVSGFTTRQKLTLTLNLTNMLMARVDAMVKDSGKSENASKAAKKRWANKKASEQGALPGIPPAAAAPTPAKPRAAKPTQALTPEQVGIPAGDSGLQPAPFGVAREQERI